MWKSEFQRLTSVTLDISLRLFHRDLLSPPRVDHLDGVLEHEDGVEEGEGGEPYVDPKEGDVSKACSYASSKGAADHEAKAGDGRDEAKPRSSRLNGRDIRDVAGDRQVENGGASCQVLEALKEDELNLKKIIRHALYSLCSVCTGNIPSTFCTQLKRMFSTLSSMNQMELTMKTRLRMKKPTREVMMRGFLPYVSDSGPGGKVMVFSK